MFGNVRRQLRRKRLLSAATKIAHRTANAAKELTAQVGTVETLQSKFENRSSSAFPDQFGPSKIVCGLAAIRGGGAFVTSHMTLFSRMLRLETISVSPAAHMSLLRVVGTPCFARARRALPTEIGLAGGRAQRPCECDSRGIVGVKRVQPAVITVAIATPEAK